VARDWSDFYYSTTTAVISILAHIYHSHYQVYSDVGLAAHLNMMTLHMVLFVEKFNLMDEKELIPLEDLIIPLKKFASCETLPETAPSEE
jgi:hypothetical protein